MQSYEIKSSFYHVYKSTTYTIENIKSPSPYYIIKTKYLAKKQSIFTPQNQI